MAFDMELIGIIGYAGYLAILAGIGYRYFKPKTADGVQICDITSSIVEAQKTFDEVIDEMDKVIKDPEIDNEKTIAYIQDAIKIIKSM